LCRDTDLEPRFAGGIEVDVCPRCRGLWLDRGELERLLDEGGASAPVAPPARPAAPRPKKSRTKRLADLLDEVLDL
jgi:Zn-finger nucleic acid-binding protein